MKRKYFGITRPLDRCGRVVIPAEYRKELDINPEDELELKIVIVEKNKKVIEIMKKEN